MGYENGFEMNEFSNEFESEFGNELEFDPEFSREQYESPLNELNELELATELLGVTNEAQMDEFMRNLFKKVGAVAKRAWNSPVGGFLRKSLGKLAPIAGTMVGGMFGGPLGAKIGGKIGSGAARLFRLELEGLSAEDQEFEIARAYVRFAGDATKRAAMNHQKGMEPKKAVQTALAESARLHAPGLLETNEMGGMDGGYRSAGASQIPASGTWFRRGNRIYIKLWS
mgnify:CR=1 FL=1